MKRLVWGLAATTALFACTSVYYGHALIRERASRTPSSAAQSSQASRQMRTQAVLAPDPPAPDAAMPDRAAMPGNCPDLTLVDSALKKLQQHKDPSLRHDRVARTRSSLADYWRNIALSMQLPPAQLEPLLDMLAEQAVRFDQERLECQASTQCPPCNLPALDVTLQERRRQNLATQLGPAMQARFDAFVYAIPERTYLQALRAELDARHALDDEKTERLALALAADRRLFIEEIARQQGRKVAVSGAGFTVQDFDGEKAPGPFGSINRDLTTRFTERVRQIAAQHLTPEQLAEFKAMQEERLANARLLQELLR